MIIRQKTAPPIQIVDFGPKTIQPGGNGIAQPDGSIALWIRVKGALGPRPVLVFPPRHRIPLVLGSETFATATLPGTISGEEGYYPFYILDEETHRKSDERVLVVGKV